MDCCYEDRGCREKEETFIEKWWKYRLTYCLLHLADMEMVINFFSILLFQLSLQKTARDLEKRDEQLNASRRVLEEQEDELLVSLAAFLHITT